MTAKDLLLEEIQDVPEQILTEVVDFVRFLKAQRVRGDLETALLSETSLQKDWLRAEEEEAWRDL